MKYLNWIAFVFAIVWLSSLLLATEVQAQKKEYVLAGVVYGKKARPEKDVYVVAYKVDERVDGMTYLSVPSNQHTLFTSYDGKFELILEESASYIIEFAKPEYGLHQLDISPKEGVTGKRIGIEVNLPEGESLLLSMQYVDAATKDVIKGARPIILDEAGKSSKTSITDKYGKCYFAFPSGETPVVLKAYKMGYFWEDPHPFTITPALAKGNAKSRELTPISIGEWIAMPEFSFGINDYRLQTNGMDALEPLFQLMKDNPGLRVEIASHTDARGDDEYNLTLSQKRADAAVQYLVDRGISPVRLRPKGYGETRLLNECKNGVRCDNQRHSENRRMAYMVYEIVE